MKRRDSRTAVGCIGCHSSYTKQWQLRKGHGGHVLTGKAGQKRHYYAPAWAETKTLPAVVELAAVI
jgi:hypothetical protein